MRPIIAISARFSDTAEGWRVPAYATGRTYCDAIVRAGGMPVVLPPVAESIDELGALLATVHGVVLPGGPDVDPACYGATERHPTLYGVRAEHDAFEIALARAAVAADLPLLAICRGMQVLNVALGGTLHQHISDGETTVKHRFEMHEVALAEGCRAALAIGTTRPVGHSVHHQAVDVVAPVLAVTAHAADGTVEGVEHPDRRWVVGVQWHPEDTAGDDGEQQALFDALVAEARLTASTRV
jgi:putative glutamine amidotransferase